MLSLSSLRWSIAASLCALMLLASACSADETGLGPPETLAGSESQVSVGALTEAVSQSAQGLLRAPGIEFTQVQHEDGDVDSSLWVESRANGDFAQVQFRDLFSQTITSPEVVVEARMLMGDTYYTAGSYFLGAVGEAPRDEPAEEPWAAIGPIDTDSDYSVRVAVPLAPMSAGSFLFPPDDLPGARVEATRAETTAGGALWFLEMVPEEDDITQIWEVDAKGRLRFHSVDVDGLPEVGTRHSDTAFAPLEDPGPITPPEIGSRLDPMDFAMPPDLPLS